MNDKLNTKWISTGLLLVSILALVVGIFTINQSPSSTASSVANGEKQDSSKLLKALKGKIKGDWLMKIDLSGPIMMQAESGGLFSSSESNAVTARKALEEAAENDAVKGVLIAINSPGGTVGMSQELNKAVTRVGKKKPVVAYFGDVAASGGYYTACAATKIVSNPGSLTGSIGVIISTLNFRELMEDKLGVRSHTIKSGKFKDLLNPYRDVRADELALIQRLIDRSYDQFIGAVLEGRTRHITDEAKKAELSERIRSIADGRILIGVEAKKMGLVDEIGDVTDAYKLLNTMAKERFKIKGKKKLPLEDYSDSSSILESLLSATLFTAQPKASGFGSLKSVVPFSMQYPNQPLWIME